MTTTTIIINNYAIITTGEKSTLTSSLWEPCGTPGKWICNRRWPRTRWPRPRRLATGTAGPLCTIRTRTSQWSPQRMRLLWPPCTTLCSLLRRLGRRYRYFYRCRRRVAAERRRRPPPRTKQPPPIVNHCRRRGDC